MSGSMSSLYVGVTGLTASQNALNTTAHNLANIGTTGYVRQQALFTDRTYNSLSVNHISSMQVGLGTNLAAVRQVRDAFLDQSYRLATGRQSYYQAQYETTDEIENVMGEMEGVQFQNSLEEFWTSIQSIANEPDNIVQRTSTVQTGVSFLERANTIYGQLENYQVSLNTKIQDQVKEINGIGQQIVDLNYKIARAESGHVENANDYRDARNALLDKLGTYGNISYSENKNGVVTVSFEGVQFVTETDYNKMGTEKISNYDTLESLSKQISALNDEIKGGNDTVENRSARAGLIQQLRNYGTVSTTDNADGTVSVKMNNEDIISSTGYDKKNLDKVSTNSEMLKPVWEFFDSDVFNKDVIPNSNDNTDIGSLKGILIARGDAAATYKNIPVRPDRSDYVAGATGDAEYKAANTQYELDVETYNKTVALSPVMSVQAQLDQLVHGIVTKINDILCPNTSEQTINITLPDGTTKSYTGKFLKEDASIGMGDGCEVPGTELFSRVGIDRYTKITDKDGKTYYLYNEEDKTDPQTLYSIKNLEVNPDVLKNVSLLPLSNADRTGDYAVDVCKKLTSAWTETFATLDPNTETKNTFKDYYTAMIGAIANKGNTSKNIADNQEAQTSSIDSQRQQVMGVSSDEELTKLLQYQHAYNAASRYFSVANDMLEQLINNLG